VVNKQKKGLKATKVFKIVQVSIDELQLDQATTGCVMEPDIDAVASSIQESGRIDPIVARKSDKTVISGHLRLIAARRLGYLGYKTVPVVFLDLSLKRARLLNSALSKMWNSFDNDLLAQMLSEISQADNNDKGIPL
jgi:hypothetical protein